MGFLDALGPSLIQTAGGYVFVTSPIILYVLARWRDGATQDPQLGVKVALGYMASVAMQVALFGGLMLVYAITTKESDERGTYVRVAFGFLLPSLAVWIGHRVALKFTNQDEYPSVRRLIAGYNLLLVGMVGFIAFLGTFQALFAKGSSGEPGRFVVAALLVYLPAWGFHGWRVFSDRTGARMPPPLVPPPTKTMPIVDPGKTEPGLPPPRAPAKTETKPVPSSDPGASKTSLPALSSGSFPPIDDK